MTAKKTSQRKPKASAKNPAKAKPSAAKTPANMPTSKADRKKKASAKPLATSKARPKNADAPGRTLSASGPVTLEEARAMAAVPSPARNPRRAAAPAETAEAASTVATVGVERQKLAQANQDESERRLAEYKSMMEILKQRGVAESPAAPPSKERRGSTPGREGGTRRNLFSGKTIAKPLQVLAEGDSWFDYPVPLFGGGIVKRLEKQIGVPILNLAKAGDEVRFMLGVKERKRLVRMLKAGSPAGGKWDALLFSGGGNDIVDNPMALWVKDFVPNSPPNALIHQARFSTILDLVRAGYEDLIQLRDQLSKGTVLIFHGYDFAIPDGRGICFIGPWLEPTFKLRNFPSQKEGAAVVKAMLEQFGTMLKSLAATNNGVVVVNTQGTLKPVSASWHNELHPSDAGFDTFASIFRAELKALFPAQVF